MKSSTKIILCVLAVVLSGAVPVSNSSSPERESALQGESTPTRKMLNKERSKKPQDDGIGKAVIPSP